MSGGSASPCAPIRPGDIEVLGHTAGFDVGMHVVANGIDYVITSIDGDTFRLSADWEQPLTGADFEDAIKEQARPTTRTKRTRCDRCNAINAPDERRCTMCRRGRCR